MMKNRLLSAILLVEVIACLLLPLLMSSSFANAKISINKKQIVLYISQKYVFKIKGFKGKVIWKSSKPSIAKVNKRGKVTALKKGKTTVSAKTKKKTLNCSVIVKKKKNNLFVEGTDNSLQQLITNPIESKIDSKDVNNQRNINTTVEDDFLDFTEQGTAAYWGYYVRDIGDDFIEVSSFNRTDDYKFVFDYMNFDVFYNGTLKINDPTHNCIEFDGEKISCFDLSKGDNVDVVYTYKKSKDSITKYCNSINVHKANNNDSSEQITYPCVQTYDVYWQCYVQDITDNYIIIVNKEKDVYARFDFDEPGFRVLLNSTIKQSDPSRNYVDISGGKSINRSSIKKGDLVDVVCEYWEGSEVRKETCYAVNVNR